MKIEGSTKLVLGLAIIFIVLGILFILESQKVGKPRLIFCDIGQGDGMLIVTPKGKQVVVDSGPGTKIVDCLAENMPFWDRTIEMMILTHAQQDHMEGQVEIFNRYKVERVVWSGVENTTALFNQWQKLLEAEKSEVHLARAGDSIQIGPHSLGQLSQGSTLFRVQPLRLDVLWPSQEKSNLWKIAPPVDINDSSVVARLEYNPDTGSGKAICAYLTGDLPKEILEGLINKPCQILKISHHGSKTGTNQGILEKVNPQIAIIQVGSKNRFGHPHKEVLDLLISNGIKILRNDTSGTIEIDTDGRSYSVN